MRDSLKSLIQQAKQAARHAHCPYSEFPVGAALLTRSGAVFTGSNVENASYGLTICAERVAIASAIAAGERRFAMMAIYTPTTKFTLPCGACRQVIAEFAPDLPVVLVNRAGRTKRTLLSKLLPWRFPAEA